MSGIQSLPELLSHALAIETEAVDRYTLLADQMEVHNNPELATIFRKLAHVEGLHAKEIEERAAGLDLPDLKPWEYEWANGDSPEAIDPVEAHYLMTPHHALKMALAAEQRAFAFFDGLAGKVEDAELRKLAKEFADEEREHVRLVEELLARYPEPPADWAVTYCSFVNLSANALELKSLIRISSPLIFGRFLKSFFLANSKGFSIASITSLISAFIKYEFTYY